MSDVDQEVQDEPRRDSDRLDQVRKWGERQEEARKAAERQLDELRAATRASAIRQAGVEPDSWTGKAVMSAVTESNISDPDDIASFVRLVQAENQGGR